MSPSGNLPTGKAGRAAKTKRHAPFLHEPLPIFVEKIHQLRLHIVRPDVELLSLPKKHGAGSTEQGV
jgi:hypothetical protein